MRRRISLVSARRLVMHTLNVITLYLCCRHVSDVLTMFVVQPLQKLHQHTNSILNKLSLAKIGTLFRKDLH